MKSLRAASYLHEGSDVQVRHARVKGTPHHISL